MLFVGSLLLLVFLFYSRMIVQGWEPYAPDTPSVLAVRSWVDRHTGGRVPQWNPETSLGMPTFGSYTYTPVGILNRVSRTLQLNRGSAYFLSFAAGAIALFALLRRWGASRPAAVAGALAVVFTPYGVGVVNAAHSSKLIALCLVPVVFWSLDGLVRRGGLLYAGVSAWALAQLVWACHPQIAYYAGFLVGSYVLVALWKESSSRKRSMLWLGVAGGLAALMVANPLLAVLRYTAESTRGAPSVLPGAIASGTTSWEGATAWSFHPKELISFVFPAFYGLEGRTYWGPLPFTQSTHALGIVTLLYAALGLWLLRGWRRVYWLAAAVGILVIGFGRTFPVLYWPLFKLMPFFDKFRVPSMIYSILPIVAAATMIVSLDAVAGGATGPTRDRARRFFRVALVVFGLLLLVGVIGKAGNAGGGSGWFVKDWERGSGGAPAALVEARKALFWTDIVRSSGFAVIVALVAIGRLAGRVPVPAFWAGTLLVLALDLYTIDRSFYRPEPPRPSTSSTTVPPDLARVVKDSPQPVRVLPLSLEQRGQNLGIQLAADTDWPIYGVQSVGGYHAAGLRRVKDFVQSGVWQNRGLWNALDAGFIAVSVPGMRLTEEQRTQLASSFPDLTRERDAETPMGDILLFHNPANLGRAFMVPASKTILDPLERLQYLGSEGFDPAREVVLEEDVPSPAATAVAAAWSAHARVDVYGDEQVAISVEGDGGFLVLADAYYKDWKATVDGAPARILPANHLVRAVVVSPGAHRVEFAFHDPSFSRGRTIGLVGRFAALALVCAGLGLRMRARRPA